MAGNDIFGAFWEHKRMGMRDMGFKLSWGMNNVD